MVRTASSRLLATAEIRRDRRWSTVRSRCPCRVSSRPPSATLHQLERSPGGDASHCDQPPSRLPAGRSLTSMSARAGTWARRRSSRRRGAMRQDMAHDRAARPSAHRSVPGLVLGGWRRRGGIGCLAGSWHLPRDPRVQSAGRGAPAASDSQRGRGELRCARRLHGLLRGVGRGRRAGGAPVAECVARAGGRGEEVPVDPYSGSSTYTVGGRSGRAIGTFRIDAPGWFLIRTEGDLEGGQGEVAVGSSIGPIPAGDTSFATGTASGGPSGSPTVAPRRSTRCSGSGPVRLELFVTAALALRRPRC
jgi:hypothetical protein